MTMLNICSRGIPTSPVVSAVGIPRLRSNIYEKIGAGTHTAGICGGGVVFYNGRYPQPRTIFAKNVEIERLRATIRAVKQIHPFTMHAFVFLHDHFHLLFHLGKNTDITKVMHSIKRNYTLNYKKGLGINGRVSLWPHGFWLPGDRNEWIA